MRKSVVCVLQADSAQGLSVAGNQAVTVLSGGNVGIGTTNPTGKLYVVDTNDKKAWFYEVTDNVGAEDVFISFGSGPIGNGNYVDIGQNSANDFAVSQWRSGGFQTTMVIQSDDGNVGIGTTAPKAKLEVNGTVSANAYITAGADYAEYFESEEVMVPGDIAGLNLTSGKVRKYQAGDELIGIVSDKPGIIGGSKVDNSVLVGLIGQLYFAEDQVDIVGRIVKTKDDKKIGVLLSNGKVFIR